MKHPIFYRTIKVDGLSIFYREAGPKNAPTILLLHGLKLPGCLLQGLAAGLGPRQAQQVERAFLRGLRPGFEQPSVLEQTIGLGDGRDTDVLLFAAFSHRWHPLSGAQRAMLDELRDPQRHLFVKSFLGHCLRRSMPV